MLNMYNNIKFQHLSQHDLSRLDSRQMHLAAMRELVAATNQQIQEREAATWHDENTVSWIISGMKYLELGWLNVS